MTTERRPKIGFIGIGDLGAAMAATIARNGYDLTVFDLREEAMAKAEGFGARRAASVAEVASTVDVVCSCVLYDDQVRQIFEGEDGIIANAKAGLIAMIHSTVHPSTVVEIAESARECGVRVMDVAVGEGRPRAIAGDLTLMAGGSVDAFEAVRPLLQVIGSKVFHLGDVGTGVTVKLANNIMALVNQLTVMEALTFAEAHGVERDKLFEVARVSSGASRAIEVYDQVNEYGVLHTLAGTAELPHRMAKDLRYAVAVAEQRQVTLPIAALCSQLSPGMFLRRWEVANGGD